MAKVNDIWEWMKKIGAVVGFITVVSAIVGFIWQLKNQERDEQDKMINEAIQDAKLELITDILDQKLQRDSISTDLFKELYLKEKEIRDGH